MVWHPASASMLTFACELYLYCIWVHTRMITVDHYYRLYNKCSASQEYLAHVNTRTKGGDHLGTHHFCRREDIVVNNNKRTETLSLQFSSLSFTSRLLTWRTSHARQKNFLTVMAPAAYDSKSLLPTDTPVHNAPGDQEWRQKSLVGSTILYKPTKRATNKSTRPYSSLWPTIGTTGEY